MKNYRNKLENIKARWARMYLSALVRSILFFEWVGSLKPAQLIVPASLLLFVNIIVSLGVYQSVYAFFLATLVIISIATLPMLFKTRIVHWVGAQESKFFNDVVTFSVIQLALGVQSYILTRNSPEAFLSLLFVSYLVSIICVFVFKSYVWLRWSFRQSAQ